MNRATRAIQLASRLSTAIVAGVAGFASFRHIAEVAMREGESPTVAYALPWAIDGLMIVSTMAMIEDKRSGRSVRWSARAAFAFGVLASLGANIASAHPTVGARVVAAVPAISLLLAVEVLSRSGKPLPLTDSAPDLTDTAPDVSAVAPRVPGVVSVPAPVMARVPDRVAAPESTADRVRRLAAEAPDASAAALAARAGCSERTVRRYWSPQGRKQDADSAPTARRTLATA